MAVEWEYKEITVKPDQRTDTLNSLGKDGWEVASSESITENRLTPYWQSIRDAHNYNGKPLPSYAYQDYLVGYKILLKRRKQ